jgi:adenylate kinase
MIIFVCGLSKVGKSNLIVTAINARFNWFRYLAAGAILKGLGRPTTQIKPSEVSENQSAFVSEAVKQMNATQGDWLIDGHLLIETIEGPQLVPEGMLDLVPIDSIYVVETSPAELLIRRKGTTAELLSEEEAIDLMALERIQARRLARRRNVPLTIVTAEDIPMFETEIEKFVRLAPSPADGH